jgi:hypothetical protein
MRTYEFANDASPVAIVLNILLGVRCANRDGGRWLA